MRLKLLMMLTQLLMKLMMLAFCSPFLLYILDGVWKRHIQCLRQEASKATSQHRRSPIHDTRQSREYLGNAVHKYY